MVRKLPREILGSYGPNKMRNTLAIILVCTLCVFFVPSDGVVPWIVGLVVVIWLIRLRLDSLKRVFLFEDRIEVQTKSEKIVIQLSDISLVTHEGGNLTFYTKTRKHFVPPFGKFMENKLIDSLKDVGIKVVGRASQ